MTRQTTSPDGLPYYQASDAPDGAAQQQDLANTLQTVLNARVPVELTGTITPGVSCGTSGAQVGQAISVTTAGLYLCHATMGFYNAGTATQGILAINNPSAVSVVATRQSVGATQTVYLQFSRLLRITALGSYTLRGAATAGTLSSDATGITPALWSLTRIAP
jgi:hypothetical protein